MVEMLLRISKIYHHESCGQCTPCRDGTGWLQKILKKIKDGEGEIKDLDLLLDITTQMEGRTICALADAAAWPVRHTKIGRASCRERGENPVSRGAWSGEEPGESQDSDEQ